MRQSDIVKYIISNNVCQRGIFILFESKSVILFYNSFLNNLNVNIFFTKIFKRSVVKKMFFRIIFSLEQNIFFLVRFMKENCFFLNIFDRIILIMLIMKTIFKFLNSFQKIFVNSMKGKFFVLFLLYFS